MPKFKIIIKESIRFRPMTIEAGDKDDAEELAIRRWGDGTVKSNVSSLAFDTEMVEEDEAI